MWTPISTFFGTLLAKNSNSESLQNHKDRQYVAIAFGTSYEALLHHRPWSSNIPGPVPMSVANDLDREQSDHHEAACLSASNQGFAPVIGYARIDAVQAASTTEGLQRPLHVNIREQWNHTGTRVWDAAWIHRRWALNNLELFSGDSEPCSVLEVGAGTGILGLSIASALGASCCMKLSDFDGHFTTEEGHDTVMHNLAYNAWLNGAMPDMSGTQCQVLTLDWTAPAQPQVWELTPEANRDAAAAMSSGTGPHWAVPVTVGVEPVDVIIGTEVVYEAGAAALLLQVLQHWLKKPSAGDYKGGFYLFQNIQRTGLASLLQQADQYGFQYEELDLAEQYFTDSAKSLLEPPLDPETYKLYRVWWKDSELA